MGCKWIERHLIIAFDGFGRFVCHHPSPFLFIPLIFSLLVSAGLLLMKTEVGVVMLFTPSSAPSRREQVIARDFISVKPIPDDRNASIIDRLPYVSDEQYADLWFNVQVAYKDRGNLITPDAWYELSRLLRYVYQNFTCSSHNGATLKYDPDFCNPRRGCLQMEEYVTKVADMLNLSVSQSKMAERIKLSYPIMYVYDKPYNWAQLIYGIKRNETSGILESARVISLFLQFQFSRREINMATAAQRCMKELADFLSGPRVRRWSENLHYYPLTERMMDTEVMQTKTYALPYLSLTIILITLFTVGSSLTPGFVWGSALEALMGVFTIGLSLLASFSFIFICGRYFNAIVIIAPFLVMCVGIDNDFLIMAAYRQTDPKLGPAKRMGAAFAAAGPSLTITSITDILCFGVGFLSDTPSVANFCLYTSVSLAFRYVYQLTFFAAVVAYVARWESEWTLHESKLRKKFRRLVHEFFAPRPNLQKPPMPLPVRVIKKRYAPDHVAQIFFRDYYAPCLVLTPVRVLAVLLYLGYVVFIVVYAAKMNVNISPQKLVVDDSPLLEYFDLAERYSWSDSVLAHVFISKPPDFRNRSEIDRFNVFVNELWNTTETEEFIDHTMIDPSDAVGLWLKDYLPYLEFVTHIGPEYVKDFYRYLPEFIETNDYKKYFLDLRFTWGPRTLDDLRLAQFRFTVFYRNVTSWEKHVELMLHWRRVCAEYKQYDAVAYDHHHLNIYLDQRLTLEPTTLQTSGIAILSMAFITAIFMPDLVSVFYICTSFLSVDLGVIGFLSLWRTDLDPVTMVCVLMTIGFSVYYTARICYCYRTLDRFLPPSEKLRLTLGAVGWPITQGGVATLLGILPLGLVKSHMVRVFFKTITLMVLIGLMHGLLIMPVIMSAFDQWRPTKRTVFQNLLNKSHSSRNKEPKFGNGHHPKMESQEMVSHDSSFRRDKGGNFVLSSL